MKTKRAEGGTHMSLSWNHLVTQERQCATQERVPSQIFVVAVVEASPSSAHSEDNMAIGALFGGALACIGIATQESPSSPA